MQRAGDLAPGQRGVRRFGGLPGRVEVPDHDGVHAPVVLFDAPNVELGELSGGDLLVSDAPGKLGRTPEGLTHRPVLRSLGTLESSCC
jgi:hypothetical protein